MKLMCVTLTLLLSLVYCIKAYSSDQAPILWKPAPQVEIEGTSADALTNDQLRAFLQKKIRLIDHAEGTVELIRIAPGYAVTMTFDLPMEAIVIGDPSLVAYKQQEGLLVLSAAQRQGDTSMQLIFQGGILLNYHLFIAPDYVDAESTVRVHILSDTGNHTKRKSRSFREVASIIKNFDLWKQEGALPDPHMQRIPVMRKEGDFVYCDFYRFPDGAAALSFAYENNRLSSHRLQPDRLRLHIGSAEFSARYTSLHSTSLNPHETTTGFVYFENPPFSLHQPFALKWK